MGDRAIDKEKVLSERIRKFLLGDWFPIISIIGCLGNILPNLSVHFLARDKQIMHFVNLFLTLVFASI